MESTKIGFRLGINRPGELISLGMKKCEEFDDPSLSAMNKLSSIYLCSPFPFKTVNSIDLGAILSIYLLS
jgi:hypothetical protein